MMQPTGNPPQEVLDQLIGLYECGQFAAVIDAARRLETEFPGSAVLQNVLGVSNAQLGRTDAAIACYERALEIRPRFAAAHNNLGNMQRDKRLLQEAAQSFRRALEIRPNFAAAHNNYGNVLKDLGAFEAAVNSYHRAIQLASDYAEAHYNLGSTLHQMGVSEQAITALERAIALKPDYAEAHFALGRVLATEGESDAAVACFLQALDLKPGLEGAQAGLLHERSRMCDWGFWGQLEKIAATIGLQQQGVSPFIFYSLDDNPARHRTRAGKFAREHFSSRPLSPHVRPTQRPARLRIGYFSAEFHEHAVTFLTAKLFRVHDRQKFEIFAYSYGPDTADRMRQDVMSNVDTFRDVRGKSDQEVAELSRRDGIHIAVDLQGFTGDTRSGIFAFRPAPVQINYLGYPGTMGVNFMDYIIADEVVIPDHLRRHYSEVVIYLPNSYMVTDDTRVISSREMSRTECGLPENGFVFCCFNAPVKITPTEFNVWMRLLRKVEGSVLWLKADRWAEANLRREAHARGVEPDRIVFAGMLDRNEEHLARYRLADLFLDTFNYNAHTTAADALWAGLPIAAKIGNSFPARVSASLLTAVGLPELIAETEDQYEAMALDLALDRVKLAAIKSKLAENRRTRPLFNTELYARHIEDAYQQAYDRYFDGRKPRSLRIRP